MTQNSQSSSQPRRRRELGAMGMLVVVGLVFFHSAQIFYYADFFVKNEPPNIQSVSQLVSTLFVAFAGLWGMPLLSVNCIEFGRADVSVVKQEIV